mmetsp:Transcript_8216/g.12563  ORF Transcript_8216/g.12563 Transcript_8216/m.12563 type:complete len:275 (-) Transcript_8216:55-879(-)|eukprot:CAMPEP_0113942902 /NCGR_PEP_ID=MMETSP1339-20121228/14684_1 /TAXON_ID=94617 /ORGANISM="Fibrocapsa japonica" /LENGTH=274 /DNA_ID=CAMNT_0000947585 /DNA_START=59 /DNA_END=883 /DNA_ORIENTATION=+ /assembly_acc=CAM_ASM_000762
MATSIFLDDSGPLNKYVLKNGEAQADVYTLGACVGSFKVSGHDFLAMRRDAVFDGTKPISGGLPICWPQFGPGAIQQHGFARNLDWAVDEISEGEIPSITLKLVDSENTRSMWNYAFELTYKVSLAPAELTAEFAVTNTGDSTMPFTTAIHSYFSTTDVSKVVLHGPFKGSSIHDRALEPPAFTTEDRDALTFDCFNFRIYPGLSQGLVLEDQVAGKALAIKSEGYEDTAIWSPFGDENYGGSSFLGVEPGNVMKDVEVTPGGKWVGTMSLESR